MGSRPPAGASVIRPHPRVVASEEEEEGLGADRMLESGGVGGRLEWRWAPPLRPLPRARLCAEYDEHHSAPMGAVSCSRLRASRLGTRGSAVTGAANRSAKYREGVGGVDGCSQSHQYLVRVGYALPQTTLFQHGT